MWDGFDKRKFPRVNLHCEISILPPSEKEPLVTKTENLGTGGVCVILNESLDRFTPCQIRLELQKGISMIECAGKVMWIVPTQEFKQKDKRFDIGIEFVNISSADRDRIRAFLQDHQDKITPSKV